MKEAVELELRNAVLSASRRQDVRRAVESVYAELADAIEVRRPICRTSGRCCRFEEFGHRLYVTTMELAQFVAQRRESPDDANPISRKDGVSLPVIGDRTHPGSPGGCPFQIDGLCSVHAIRPFGCRIFFCDETSTAWQQEMYEKLHGQLRRMHDELGVAYHYVEWRFALEALKTVVLHG